MRIDHNIRCGTQEKRELLKEKLKLAKGLVNSDSYSTIIKALDFLIQCMLKQMSKNQD